MADSPPLWVKCWSQDSTSDRQALELSHITQGHLGAQEIGPS